MTPNFTMPEYDAEVPLQVESRAGNRIGALRLLLLAALTPLLLATQCAIHEAGHCVVVLTQGGHVRFAQLGYWQVYPQPTVRKEEFDLLLGFGGIWNQWPMMMAGSTATLVVALIIALLLPSLSNAGVRRAATALGLICLADLPFYVFLPPLGIRHWILYGGRDSEPTMAAALAGIPRGVFEISVAVVVAMVLGLYARALSKRSPDPDRAETA
ncbi:MAG: hypothetical protein NDJ92_04640 [Thermoanaerobaculia bacterium]|nr:hypothetical protein [Thermoanaerobaculia bacterium]